jgi:predicted ATPase
MVGREQELKTLRGEWDRTLDGGLALALVSGEPGIGKSRLAREPASVAQADGAKVLLGSCSAEPLVPYLPFIEALEGSGEAMEHERMLQLLH